MEVQFTPEEEAQLSRLASHEGKNPQEFAKDVLLRTLEDNERFLVAVQVGIDQADRGEFVSHEEVKARIERFLQQ
jgi:predicted transcriptional regulator